MLIGPVKVFPALPMLIVPPPLPQKLSPTPVLPEITPISMRLPLVVLFVMLGVAVPRLIGIAQVSLPVPVKVKLPPILSRVGAKALLPED